MPQSLYGKATTNSGHPDYFDGSTNVNKHWLWAVISAFLRHPSIWLFRGRGQHSIKNNLHVSPD